MPSILRFLNIIFLMFEQGGEQKICAMYFEICKYAFLIFEKEDKQKIVPGILRLASMLF